MDLEFKDSTPDPGTTEPPMRYWQSESGIVSRVPATSDFPAGRPGTWHPVSIVPEFPTVILTAYTGYPNETPRIEAGCPDIDVEGEGVYLHNVTQAREAAENLRAEAAMRSFLARAVGQWADARQSERDEKTAAVLRGVVSAEVDDIMCRPHGTGEVKDAADRIVKVIRANRDLVLRALREG